MIGPTLPWEAAQSSYVRARRALDLGLAATDASSDAADHLVPLVLPADPETLADLRAKVLPPMDGLRPSTVDKLVETLPALLLHPGRRDTITAALFLLPQPVLSRSGRLRAPPAAPLPHPP